MKKKMSHKELVQKAQIAREIEMVSMEHHEPSPEAAAAFRRKPYQTVSVMEYMGKLKNQLAAVE